MSLIEQASAKVRAATRPREQIGGRMPIVSVSRRRTVYYGVALTLLATVSLTLAGCSLTSSTDQTAAQPTMAAQDFAKAEALRTDPNQHCDRAIPLYLSAIRKNPMYVNAYSGLGACYVTLGDYDGAVLEYDRAIAIDSTNYGLYLSRAGVEAVNGNTGAATIDDKNALRFAPLQVPTYVSIANSFTTFADFADAISTISKAIDLVPDSSTLYAQRAKWYLLMQDTRRAYDDAQQALKVAPNAAARASIDVDLATVYSQRGDTNSALYASADAIKLQPNVPYYYIQSGDVHRTLGLFDGALSRYNQALKLANDAPDKEAALEGKGDALRALGRFKEAIPPYQQALRYVKGDRNKQYVLNTKIQNAKLGQY